ncbi:5'-nucleotidase C-terminal domain-containing protein [Fusibacter paucivorans]|uniref:5'-nucleotidase C-terminal domain-containing protein n=1 Tax=Fusibacter paucivorans TaxID=76009 RepID=A0ABS5PK05_9FIRM|nr:5'-nucleotidase C-terminal domain-containing protein [Fusibacter paucivorans]MBS7525485.1 5'-nucleotidase C-terminal domain-containing protein [Fusibacter paucivorans]
MFRNKGFLSVVLVLMLVMSSVVSFGADGDVTIDVYSFNDFHGSLAESGKNVGMAKLVGAVNALRAENPNTIIVSAGDNYQGSAMSNLSYGEPVSDMMKMLGVSVSAVGNHEFDWGVDRIPTWAADADLTFVASNIYDIGTSEPVTWATPYVIQEIAGKKIAFIGLTTIETAYKTKAENVATLEFKDPAEAAKIWVDYLLAGNDAAGVPDAIIALTHTPASQDGYGADPTLPVTGEEMMAITAVEGLDGVVAAHNHATVAGYANDVPVVEAYYNGRALGHLTLVFSDDELTVTPSVDELYKRSEEITPDPDAMAAYDKWNETLAPTLNEVLGQAVGEMTHDRYDGVSTTVLGQWVCEVMAEDAGVQIGIQNGGGLRRSIPSGDITYGIMYEVMPFDNTLVTMKLKGSDLLKNIEHGIGNEDVGNASFSGLQVAIDSDKPFGERVLSLSLADGTPIDMDAYYTVVINDFMYPSGDNFDFSNAIDVTNTFVPIRDALVDAVKAGGSVNAKPVTAVVEYDTYNVASGDVLWKIAKAHGVTYQQLAAINGLSNPNMIHVGQMLMVPEK